MEAGLEVSGRYRLERTLGGGSFGEVWRATDLLRDQVVAIKFLHREISVSNPIVLSKFRQEAKIAVRLEHPGITRVDDFGEDRDGRWYLVMEFLHGRDLAAELADHPGGLPTRRVLSLAVQLADALVAAHGIGVVHRDLKPANLMLLPGDRLKICDFGIAQMVDASTAQTFDGPVGTPSYMAPEQWLGQETDHRTDLYALGGILYTLLTGHPPFNSDRAEGLMGQHLNIKPPRVRADHPDVPAALDKLIAKLLAKKPDRRPTHTHDVLTHLHHIEQRLTPPATAPRPPGEPPIVPHHRPTPPGHRLGPSRRILLTTAALSLAAAAPLALVAINPETDPPAPTRSPTSPGVSTESGPPDYREHHLLFTLAGHKESIQTVMFNPDGTALATGSDDGTAKLWNARTGELITTLTGHKREVWDVVFSPDGTVLATSSLDGTVRLWNARTGELTTTLTGHTDGSFGALFSPDSTTVVTSSGETVKLWDARTGELTTTLTGHTGWVQAVAFIPDGTALAVGCDDGTVRLWDARTGELTTTLTGHTNSVFAVAFSPDGTTLATGSGDTTAKLWNAKSGELIATLTGHKDSVPSAVFSSDGTTLATGSIDATAKLWNAKTGELTTTLTGHTHSVYAVAFDPDGTTLATGSLDATAKLWNAKTGELTTTLTGHEAAINAVAFDPDGTTLATGSGDATAKLWGE
ncbi:WD40 repeat domain-containing serine/threonine protein kinase [Streptosporangium amethystogenes subsp. fukuiense]|uniref:WD40 repeat domain-containing serine/threonine protein kinase n=1 Tax=Streptosporangium amethystogenes subsp. fukuiense TaxID=698418 RepID=A0ABW2T7D0_9ACTN